MQRSSRSGSSCRRRLLQLVSPAFGQPGRRVGGRGHNLLQDYPAHAQKNEITNRKIQYRVIPPETDAGFAAAMEEVLAVGPGVSCGVHGGATHPVAEGNPNGVSRDKKVCKRVDYEYERAGTASIFLFFEALVGWRKVTVWERTKSPS